MKAISKRQHKSLLLALEWLHELHEEGVLPDDDDYSTAIRCINEKYDRHQALLDKLSVCIADYMALYKAVRVYTVAPAFRHARRKLASQSTAHTHLQKCADALRGD